MYIPEGKVTGINRHKRNGTPEYMAPEVIMEWTTFESDVWAAA
jgi:serine/threonine protein kinase